MSTEVKIPKLGLTMEAAILQEWHVAEGETVAEGDVLAEIGTDKITHEIEAPSAGTITNLHPASDEDELPVGAVIATID